MKKRNLFICALFVMVIIVSAVKLFKMDNSDSKKVTVRSCGKMEEVNWQSLPYYVAGPCGDFKIYDHVLSSQEISEETSKQREEEKTKQAKELSKKAPEKRQLVLSEEETQSIIRRVVKVLHDEKKQKHHVKKTFHKTVVIEEKHHLAVRLENKDAIEAKHWFGLAEKYKTELDVDSKINYAREYVQKAKLTIKDFGYTEEKINEVLRQGYISEAKHWFDLAEKGKDKLDVTSKIDYAREYTKKAKLSINDFGYTEEKINEVLHQSYISEAKQWFDLAEKGKSERDVESKIGYAREYVQKAKLTIKDFGYTEEKIKEVLHEGYISEAIFWFDYNKTHDVAILSAAEYADESFKKAKAIELQK